MARFNRRRLPARRLQRPARPAAQPPAPINMPEEKSGASTEFDVSSIGALSPSPRPSQQDSTVELAAMPRNVDPNAETAEAISDDLPPPPKRLEFPCACGTILVATAETYDKHTRCAMCQTVMLLNLVYDPEQQTHEIVPFRINPNSLP